MIYHHEIELLDYHRLPGLSSTGLRYLEKSPAHYKAWKDGLIKLDSKALELGSKVHLLLESAEKFYETYVIRPFGLDLRTKNGKELQKEVLSTNRELIHEVELDQVEAIVQSFRYSSDRLIAIARDSEGFNEVTVLWEERGLPMRCRPDRLVYPSESDGEWLCQEFPDLFIIPFGLSICVDYKTTSKFPDPKTWFYACQTFGYPLAASHYLKGTNADAFLWVVLEVNPPYTVTRYLLSPRTKELMDERREQLLDLLQVCEAKQDWPSLMINNIETLI